MKMFLTRIGFGSKAVVTGDTTQVDLPRGQVCGLVEATEILNGVRGIAFTRVRQQRRGPPPAGRPHRRCV
jgi:phosphate starvation-inducible PhoH-like protein